MTIRIQLITLSALLVIAPAQTGFKDKVIRTLPWAGMAVSGAFPAACSLAVCEAIIVSKNAKTDQKATQWAHAILNKNNQYSATQLPPVAISPSGEWFAQFRTIFVPENYASQEAAPVFLKHEWGHIVHNDTVKGGLLNCGALSCVWAAQCSGLRYLLGTPKTVLRSYAQAGAFVTIPLISACLLHDHVLTPFNKGEEYRADDFAIKNTDNPDELRTAGYYFLMNFARGIKGGRTHPANLERSQTFFKAARELDWKKTQETKSIK